MSAKTTTTTPTPKRNPLAAQGIPASGTTAAASLYQQLRAHLAVLKLHDAAEALPSVLDAAAAEKLSMTAALERLLAIEVDATEARRLAGRLRFACLPTPATLADFDYDAAAGLDRSLVEELGTCRYLDSATNVLLIGPPGVGKTHLAVGLARSAAHAGYRTYFTTAADLAARCHRAVDHDVETDDHRDGEHEIRGEPRRVEHAPGPRILLLVLVLTRSQQHRDADDGAEHDRLLAERVDAALVEVHRGDDVRRAVLHRGRDRVVAVRVLRTAERGHVEEREREHRGHAPTADEEQRHPREATHVAPRLTVSP